MAKQGALLAKSSGLGEKGLRFALGKFLERARVVDVKVRRLENDLHKLEITVKQRKIRNVINNL